jgi:hypothetical protein
MSQVHRSVLREGVVAGLIGAATVALWFLIYDAWRGQPLLTPALLGSAIFYGVSGGAGVQIAAGPVIGYTIVHLLAFIGFGIVAACMMVASEREPAIFIAFVTLFGVFEVFFFAVLRTLSQEVLGTLGWWAILTGNFLAAIGMLWFLVRGHPELPSALIGSSGPVLREGVVAGVIGSWGPRCSDRTTRWARSCHTRSCTDSSSSCSGWPVRSSWRARNSGRCSSFPS